MILSIDITEFMQWWLTQVYTIMTEVYSILENITFMGTNLLEVMIAIIIIGIILRIFLSVAKNTGNTATRNERVGSNRSRRVDNE